MSTNSSTPTPVDFWFDPSCPWAWMASRWVDEVARLRNLDVNWHVMSLAVLNEDKDVSEEYRAFFPRALRYTRLVAAVRELHGQSAVKPLYDALGTRIHPGKRKDCRSDHRGGACRDGLACWARPLCGLR